MWVRIKVTKDDIQKGKRRGSMNPVERSCRRKLKINKMYTGEVLVLCTPTWIQAIRLPAVAQEFIQKLRFNHAHRKSICPLEPFEFKVNVPKHFLK